MFHGAFAYDHIAQLAVVCQRAGGAHTEENLRLCDTVNQVSRLDRELGLSVTTDRHDRSEGRNREAAELRFFSGLDAGQVATPPTPPAPPVPPRKPLGVGPLAPSAEAGDVVGLFPTPGRAS